jgi:hypothetical protein
MYSLHRSRLPSLSVRSRSAETSNRAWPRYQPRRHRLFGYGSNAGAPRFLESPSHTSATLYDSGRSGRPHPIGRHNAVPAIPTTKTPAILISELNTVASASAVYASSGALPHPHARLASGWWLAIAGRESNPLDFKERFLSTTSDSPFPRLILARRKVSAITRQRERGLRQLLESMLATFDYKAQFSSGAAQASSMRC